MMSLHRVSVRSLAALLGSVLGGGALACSGQLDDTTGSGPGGTPMVDSNGDGVPDPVTDSNGDGIPDTGMDDNGDGVPDPVTDPTASGVGWSTRVPRLSHRQWENSVRDLLKLPAEPGLASAFTPDPSKRFDTNIEDSKVSAGLWTDYQTAAETLANQVASDPALLAGITPANLPTDPAAQGAAFVTEFGRRAFRRPLEQLEIDGLVALFNQGPTLLGGDAFAAGVNLVIRAVLQSPYFLYRVESSTVAANGRIALSGYEIASRLSYALLNTVPPDALLDAAAAGALDTPAGIQQWATTLLDDARSAQTVQLFHEQLFRVAGYGSISKDPELFPNFTTDLQPALQQEARAFFNQITVAQGGGIRELLTTPITFVNDELAPFYGLQGTFGSELQQVNLDATERAGILTQLGFLATYGTLSQSDPIHRGVLISSNLLCQKLTPPANGVPPLPAIEPNQTNRQRIDAHTSACGGACHATLINPLGFAFENYDAIGQWRDTDNGQPVDATGTYSIDGAMISFNDAVQLSGILAESTAVHNCYAGNWVEYAIGRVPIPAERTAIDAIGQQSRSGASAKAVLAQVTSLELFRTRGEDPVAVP
jgi:hypothetical protein